MYLNKKQCVSLIVISFFLISISFIIYVLQPNYHKDSISTPEHNALLDGDISFSNLTSDKDRPLSGTVTLSNNTITYISNIYIDNLTSKKSLDLDLSIKNGALNIKAYFTILNLRTSANFDINIINKENNKFRLEVSNLSLGKISLDNKFAHSIVKQRFKDNHNIQFSDSNIYIDIDLSEHLSPIEISNTSINDSHITFEFSIPIKKSHN